MIIQLAIDQFVYIDIIKACRTLGSSILELQEIFKECDTDKLIEFLQLKRSEAEANINKMKEVINNIYTLNTSVKKSKAILNNDKISIQPFEERYIIVAPFEEEGSIKQIISYIKENKFKVKNIVEVELFNDFFNIESYSCQIQVLIADNF